MTIDWVSFFALTKKHAFSTLFLKKHALGTFSLEKSCFLAKIYAFLLKISQKFILFIKKNVFKNQGFYNKFAGIVCFLAQIS